MRRSPMEQFERVARGRGWSLVGSHGSVLGTMRLWFVQGSQRSEIEPVLPGMRVSGIEGRELGVRERMGPLRGIVGEARYPMVKGTLEVVRVLNRGGLAPYSYSRTSQLIIAASRARTRWFWKGLRGIDRHGGALLGRLRPQGTPLAMVPIRVGLEVRGFVITSISLSVRLFANLMAGHILLKVLGGFGWVRLGQSLDSGVGPLVALLRLFVLETAVACVQAYVFTLLRCLYRADIVHGGH